jgi:hypothetical protein
MSSAIQRRAMLVAAGVAGAGVASRASADTVSDSQKIMEGAAWKIRAYLYGSNRAEPGQTPT